MSGSKLDQIVKGAPPPGTSVPSVVSRSPSPAPLPGKSDSNTKPSPSVDPTTNFSSSPPLTYLNLLILEASLRSQYLTLRNRRRQNTFFILLLTAWIAWFTYLLFLRPREDGSGVGGSVYWVVEMGEKVALMGGIFTGMLIWGTGQWERGVRWPRRWLGVTNRGLRIMNAKVVLIKGSWWQEMFGHLTFLFPYSSFFPAQGASYKYMEHASEKPANGDDLVYGEDLSPGGDYIKVLLLPKPFSPDFRENWELYRLEYWEKENERRAHLRELMRKREREIARQHGGWFWWIGWRGRRPRPALGTAVKGNVEKTHQKHLPDKDNKRPSAARPESHSRNPSRSSTPEERPSLTRTRRASTTASGSERKRKAKQSTSAESPHISRLSPINPPA